MPDRVRYIQRKDTTMDHFVRELLDEEGYGVERQYFGITDRERADDVRKKMKNAGRHLGVSVKSFWVECTGCKDGGDDCRYHVKFSAYDPEEAKEYMRRKGEYGSAR